MDAVGKEDEKGFGKGIDPEGRAGEAGVAVRAERKMLAAQAAEAGIDVPAEAAAALPCRAAFGRWSSS